jgi:hypothetical protein
MKRIPLAAAWYYSLLVGFLPLGLLPGSAAAADTGFALRDKAGQHLDVLLDGKIVARYMYAYDRSTPERLQETYKPYLHVFDAEGKAPITNGGPTGLYPHHRGIFIGWMKIGVDGQTFDRWHMKGGEIVHQKFLDEKADHDHATFTSQTGWNDAKGKAFLEEERTVTVRRALNPGRLLIDCTFRLKSLRGAITLDGDPEHSGVHFRPANDIVKEETVYEFPRENANAHKDLDYPWVGEAFTMRGKQYSVVEMNSPENPRGTRFSAYRDYGRVGAFPKAEIQPGQPLVLKYRFLIVDGKLPRPEMIQKLWDDFAGVKTPSPAPKVTVTPAERPASKKK